LSEKYDKGVTISLAALTVLLFVFQYVTLAKFSVFRPGVTYWELRLFVDAVSQKVPIGWGDGLLASLILLPIGYLVAIELTPGRLTTFLGWIFDDERRTRISLTVASLIAIRYYFAPGSVSWAGDAPQHLSYLSITSEILLNLEVPIWTNYYGAGSPFLQFYGFLYFILGGAINVILRDVDLSTKRYHTLFPESACIAFVACCWGPVERRFWLDWVMCCVSGMSSRCCSWGDIQLVWSTRYCFGRLPTLSDPSNQGHGLTRW